MAMADEASQASIGSFQIDPQLLLDSGSLQAALSHPTGANPATDALSGPELASTRNIDLSPHKDTTGTIIVTPEDYEKQL